MYEGPGLQGDGAVGEITFWIDVHINNIQGRLLCAQQCVAKLTQFEVGEPCSDM